MVSQLTIHPQANAIKETRSLLSTLTIKQTNERVSNKLSKELQYLP